MIGECPTVGCLILIEKASFSGLGSVVQALQPALNITIHPGTRNAAQDGTATLGDSRHEMIMLAQEAEDVVAVQIEFDEDEVEGVKQATGLSVEQLFMPYVQAAKTLPGVVAVGIGFELSPPADLREETTQEVGIAVLFYRDEAHKSWARRQTMPLVGHYA